MAKDREKASVSDYQILDKPVITEKSSIVGGDGSCVTFRVKLGASKVDIKRAIERIYDVRVRKIRTCNYAGKLKRTNRSVGRRANFRKAYVTLQPGQSIDIVEGL